MPFCYIIHSKSANRFYIGCSHDVQERIQKHNDQTYGTHHFTAIASDWTLYLSIETQTIEHALRLEKKIKRMKSRKYIMNLRKYQDLREKIFLETMGT